MRNFLRVQIQLLGGSVPAGLRNCIGDLRGNMLDCDDFNRAIREILTPILHDTGLQVRFNVPRKLLSNGSAHAVFSIVRELAANAVRHGKSSSVRIAGTLDKGSLRFPVSDDGVGFEPERRPGIKVMVVDDHAIVRMGLAALFETQADLVFVGAAEDGAEAVRKARRLNPDVIVMDLMMPVMDGVAATREIVAENPSAKVIVLTTSTSSEEITQALEAGAAGRF